MVLSTQYVVVVFSNGVVYEVPLANSVPPVCWSYHERLSPVAFNTNDEGEGPAAPVPTGSGASRTVIQTGTEVNVPQIP